MLVWTVVLLMFDMPLWRVVIVGDGIVGNVYIE
jgi:hypothetical protein